MSHKKEYSHTYARRHPERRLWSVAKQRARRMKGAATEEQLKLFAAWVLANA